MNIRGSQSTVIKSGEGNDIVNVTLNVSWKDKPYPANMGLEPAPIIVETGEGNDTVFSSDNSEMIIDGQEVGTKKS
jgi:hypothetical protein